MKDCVVTNMFSKAFLLLVGVAAVLDLVRSQSECSG